MGEHQKQVGYYVSSWTPRASVSVSVSGSWAFSCRLPSVSWWRKGRAFQNPEQRTWRCTIPEPNTLPSPRLLPAPRRLWTHTAAPPSRRSWYWPEQHKRQKGYMIFQNSMFHFNAQTCLYLQDDVEGASQCCLAKVALCSHSQYIRDLLGRGKHICVYACISTSIARLY